MTLGAFHRNGGPPTDGQVARRARIEQLIAARVPRDRIAAELGISMSTLVCFAGRFGLTLPYRVRKARAVPMPRHPRAEAGE